MATRMLIDARHPEETRVAVLTGNRIEEFDFESAEHKQIKGNIYLAKVIRVEPSLQAAFVDFGGNRHGFLAFSEIHPDYYQIPAGDRAALLAEEQAAAEEEAALRDEEDEDNGSSDLSENEDDEDEDEDGLVEIDTSEKDEVATIEDGLVENGDGDDHSGDADEEDASGDSGSSRSGRRRGRRQGRGGNGNGNGGNGGNNRRRGSGEGSRAKEIDDVRARRQALRRRYKIQDVIQRRQVLLVQVVKEERGNKGAALTSYLSLAGRYCVLMPNSSSGGGISRKISSGQDRNRLKQIVSDLSLPRSMGLIVRTAGLERNKTEIKRDFDYLARLWDEIREKTLASSAPAVIHSDNDLIKRAIRDIYHREIEEVVVEGEEGHVAAKQFMKLLMPSHARRVKQYSDPVPLFQRYGAEDQLSAMYEPLVQLKSGGYLVINPTEALVSIDINSGRSTREHGIEQTALSTNLEAAREIARQLRLRDMAGLVVIDFIDMEQNSSNRKVEKALKEALKNDRARIQVGRISGFGLMEMSRQRLRTGVLEASTRSCPHCDGIGLVRTASSAGLAALRLIEDEAAKGKGSVITLYASTEASIYLLNAKRADLTEIEERYHVTVEVMPEGEEEGAKMRIASSGPPPAEKPRFSAIVEDEEEPVLEDEDDEEDEEDETEVEAPAARQRDRERTDGAESEDEEASGKKKRRRRRRGGRNRNRNPEADDRSDDQTDESEENEDSPAEPVEAEAHDEEAPKPARRSRSRRRDAEDAKDEPTTTSDAEAETEQAEAETEQAEQPAKPRRRRRKADVEGDAAQAEVDAGETGEEAAAAKPKPRARRARKDPDEPASKAPDAAETAADTKPDEAKPAPRRRGGSRSTRAAAPSDDAPGEEAPAFRETSATGAANDPGSPDEGSSQEAGSPRRGWWQRTFGA